MISEASNILFILNVLIFDDLRYLYTQATSFLERRMSLYVFSVSSPLYIIIFLRLNKSFRIFFLFNVRIPPKIIIVSKEEKSILVISMRLMF